MYDLLYIMILYRNHNNMWDLTGQFIGMEKQMLES